MIIELNLSKNKFLRCSDLTLCKIEKDIFSSLSRLSLLLSKILSGKFLTSSEFVSVSEIFSIKASLSCISPSQVYLEQG